MKPLSSAIPINTSRWRVNVSRSPGRKRFPSGSATARMESDLDRFTSRRSTVYAGEGLVATSQPLAAEAGRDVLREGGNAFDAAVATAAALNVVEPTSTGIGGDVFACYRTADGDVGAMRACGGAPGGADSRACPERCGRRGGQPPRGKDARARSPHCYGSRHCSRSGSDSPAHRPTDAGGRPPASHL